MFPLLTALLFATPSHAQEASKLFADKCALCHGPDAHGTERGPNLANNRRVRARTAAQLRTVIRNGYPQTGMPPFDLPATDLDALATLVASFSGAAWAANPPGDKVEGEKYFHGAGRCSNCHIAQGHGKAVGPDLSRIASEMTLAQVQEAVRKPSERIKPGYEVVNLQLRDGSLLRGLARNQSQYSIQLQDLNGKFHSILPSQIAKRTDEKKSLMPDPTCSEAQCQNLIAYVCTLTGNKPDVAPSFTDSGLGPTFDQILHPKPGDWPTYHGNITGNRHSPLNQITPDNVKNLELKWIFPMNHYVVQATPLVVDGVMYVSGPNQVFAIDAQTGKTIWHYLRDRSTNIAGDPAKGTNRGVALLGDIVYLVTDNAHVVAIHRITGQELWDTQMIETKNPNYGNTSAPLVVKDMVIAGIAGGDSGIRGFLSAYHAKTGKLLWRIYTTPKPGEPLSETWKGTDLEKFGGGGGTWMVGTYDSDTDTIFWGVGNPYPAYNGDQRQGDNLYTASVLALNPQTGKLKWHYQFNPHDLHDWDSGQVPMVLNAKFKGRDRKLLIEASRNGFFYVLDRTNGELLLAEKFVDRLNWAKGIGKDGRPIIEPGTDPTPEGAVACPSVLGATNWMSMAYNPTTKLFYLAALEACMVYVKPPGSWKRNEVVLPPGQKFLRALDIETGKRVWELPQTGPSDSWGGVLSTESGVIFFGEDSGAFAAADAKTGKQLWHLQTNSATSLGDGHSWRASPMTFLAAGKQYVAIASGPNILCFGLK